MYHRRVELVLAHVNHLTHGKFRIGQDVYDVLEAADAPHPQVTTLYLGDSVARQLFPMEAEPSPALLYLPSNQAISVAGQFCILQQVAARAPHLRRVYLFYAPRSWANDLDQIFTHDYFCGYFHNPSLVWEIWTFKHDRQLTEAARRPNAPPQHHGREQLPESQPVEFGCSAGGIRGQFLRPYLPHVLVFRRQDEGLVPATPHHAHDPPLPLRGNTLQIRAIRPDL